MRVRSEENFVLACKSILHVIRCDPKLTIKSKKIGHHQKCDADFVNAMLLNWPSLKDLTPGINPKVLKFLKNVKFEHCDRRIFFKSLLSSGKTAFLQISADFATGFENSSDKDVNKCK